MMFWYGNTMSGWGYALMTISMVLFLALVIAGVVALIRFAGQTPGRSDDLPKSAPTPHQVLAERFARGDIDEDEYRQRTEALHGHASHAGKR